MSWGFAWGYWLYRAGDSEATCEFHALANGPHFCKAGFSNVAIKGDAQNVITALELDSGGLQQ